MRRLKAETRELHRATERLPYAVSLFRGGAVLGSFQRHLGAFRRVLGALDARLAQASHPAVQRIASEIPSRLAHLDADLAELGAAPLGLELGRRVADIQHQLARAAFTPVQLLGWLYVFEGSSLGSQILAPKVDASLRLGGRGLSYLVGHDGQTRTVWSRFGNLMNAEVREAEHDGVVAGAGVAFRAVGRLFEALSIPLAPACEENAASILSTRPGTSPG